MQIKKRHNVHYNFSFSIDSDPQSDTKKKIHVKICRVFKIHSTANVYALLFRIW